jgi:hypothetical protein
MPLTDGLISYWKLDEASGNALDAHDSFDLTDTGTAASVAGKINTARDLATSKYFDGGNVTELGFGDEDFTVAGWVKLSSKPGLGRIINKFSDTAGYQLSYRSDLDRFYFAVGDSDSSHIEDADNLGSPSTGVWYFIVAWHDSTANTVNIQVNNGTVDSGSYSAGVSDPGANFLIGFSGSASVDGAVDEFGVWGRVLTAQERTDLYNDGSGLAYDFSGGEVQLLAPIQDISAGTWLPSSGSPAELWQMIDGEQSPDSDYCYTTSAGTMEVKFAPGSTPSLQSGHTLSYRLRGNGTCDALVKLKVGSTVLAQWTETNVPAVDTDYSHTLDSSPSFTISDYTDLRISVEAVP